MLLPFLFFVLRLLCFLPSSLSLCHPDEAAALLHFKNSFSIISVAYYCSEYDRYYVSIEDYYDQTSYPKTESWNESSDCCKWEGVSCDNVTGHVTGLDLSCSQLEGPFPPNSTLFNGLLHLQTLNLSSNYGLHSEIPVELGRLTALKHLDLSYSSFHGHVPSTISHLSNLESLDLSNLEYHYFSSNVIVKMESSVFGELVQNLSRIRHLFLDGLDMSGIKVNDLLANFSSTLTSFSAGDCQMKGSLREGIFNLPKLELIHLWGNRELTGNLPDSISQSTSLKYLKLRECSLSGSIPNSLGNLSHLVSLNLELNYFSGGQFLHFLTNLTQLSELELSGCLLSGFIPNFIGTKLRVLSLQENKLQGIIPSSIYEQKNLLMLNLSSNNLSGLVDLDRLSKLQHLGFLDLGYNMLTFTPSTGITFPSLQSLSIPSLGISEFPDFSSNNLFYLDISNNRIHHIPKWMFDLSRDSLNYLNLSYNSIEVLEQIPWKRLRILDIRSNSIHGEISSSICLLDCLRIIDLSHNMFEASIPQCLSNSSSSLSVLNLGKNKLSGKIPSTFAEDCLLEYLDLNGNQLEGTIPESISHCKGLQVLNLGTNRLNGSIPGWVETLLELQVLILHSNKFHGSLETFSNHKHPFRQLQVLDLSNNHFSGHIPGSYMKNFKSMVHLDCNLTSSSMYMHVNGAQVYEFSVSLTMKGSEVVFEKVFIAFTSIDLSCNNFYGEIPEEIGMLGALKGLNLSHNKLSGQIPQSLGYLKNIEWLDLSSNKLTGHIPEQLEDLTFLGTLNLSYNQLTGPIPVGRQSSTYPNDSYIGNEGLCGFPLSKSCGNPNAELPPASDHQSDSVNHQSVIEWKAVLMGYPCGLSLGISIACFIFRNGDPDWFQKLLQLVGITRRGRR